MIKIDHQLTINRAPEEVFAYLSDPTNNAKWDPDVVESKMTSTGEPSVGSTMVETRKFLGRKLESHLEVTAYDPPNTLGIKVVKGPVPFEITYQFTPEGGGTNVSITGQADAGGFFKLAEGLVAKQLKSSIEKTHETLKGILEG